MSRGVLGGLLWACGALLCAADAGATTVTIGPPSLSTSKSFEICTAQFEECPDRKTVAQTVLTDPGVLIAAPAPGRITSWSAIIGEGEVHLRVLRFTSGEFGAVGAGTSAAATNKTGGPNPTDLPVAAGDLIGADLVSDSLLAVQTTTPVGAGTVTEWNKPSLPEGEATSFPTTHHVGNRLMLNAQEVLAPAVGAVAPTTGNSHGGNQVTISGKYLDGATGVMFGATPASSFTVEFPSQITAVAPVAADGTVDVRVVGPGGTSEVNPGDRYTFATPPAPPAGGSPSLTGAGVEAHLAVSSFAQSASRWRVGGGLPAKVSASHRAPVGTTFTFSLNKAATATIRFSQRVGGRRVGGRCAAPSAGNARKPRCTRTVTVAAFSVPGHAGVDKLRFQGHVSAHKSLTPGTYTASLTARDASGAQSSAPSLSFTIVTH